MLDKKILFAASAFALALPASAIAQDTGAATGTTQQSTGIATGTATSGADTSITTDTNTEATVAAGPTVAATAADITAGAMVHDPKGGMVGTIESVSATGAVVSTGKSRVQLPLASFAKNKAGLVISLSKDELDAQAAAASSGGSAEAQ